MPCRRHKIVFYKHLSRQNGVVCRAPIVRKEVRPPRPTAKVKEGNSVIEVTPIKKRPRLKRRRGVRIIGRIAYTDFSRERKPT